jgi:RNA 2',3'-cyclic 3'-phosphodiesterase
MRLFIAIPIPETSLKEIIRVQDDLHSTLEKAVRWADPQSIHLTLKFLGEVQDLRKIDIVNSVEKSCQQICRFSLECCGLGVFPNIHLPNIIWVGIDSPPELLLLQQEIENNLSSIGFIKEKKKFSPHLTLGRVRTVLDNEEKNQLNKKVKDYFETIITSFGVSEIQLIKSELKSAGPIYTNLKTIKLLNVE